ncbi:DeoR/GlpR family DNA-binding transcription regulator [Stappia indica]|uniref:DeoR/GlpR family DNA-binding transcription regulator n=1 Tax=Stappia indica TaxID=538381 RepID=UPI001CD54DAD|nr:DeoR/GlpR family DNA-binding transcription regulator [Stappia indica]MCA1298165.1 DeoR/GlpR family DNA-binding transcription regulator [Stappia indica]
MSDTSPFPAEHRRALILEELDRHQAVTIRALSDRLGVSRETLRKDIALLAEANCLRQVRGGAVIADAQEPPVEERTQTNPEGKRAMARHAAGLVADNASVLIDSGTSTRMLAELLARRSGLSIFTNDLRIALDLRASARAVHVLGGQLGTDEEATQGLDAIDMLRGYTVDIAFVGVGGLSADRLVSDFSRDGAALRCAMLAAARRPVLLADHSKIDRPAPVRLTDIPTGTRLITDRPPTPPLTQALESAGMTLDIAPDIT